jgi:cell division protease FtsH
MIANLLTDELRKQLPGIATALGCVADDLAIVDYEFWPKEYMLGEMRDKVVSVMGMSDGLPIIQRYRSQRPGPGGIGITYYENRLSPDIKYAISFLKGTYDDEYYLIVPKAQLFKLRRNVARLNKKCNKANEIPILPEGLMEEIIQNTVGFLLKAKEIEKYGVKIKRGLVLDGDPGNGKTMICRHIQKMCSQNGIRWGTITSADIDDAYQHKTLIELFQDYPVAFFDDIDVAYLNRAKGNGKIACSLLTAMDGMSQKGHLVRIFTTNEPLSELDPAFTRPGRIDKCITLRNPDEALRKKLVQTVWPEEIKLAINLEDLLAGSDGYSFAELEAIRTLLVTNKTLGDGHWDLKKAFKEFQSRRAEKRKGKGVGFGTN